MLTTTIVGSLPKPTWLAEPERLWAPWRVLPERLAEAQRDAVLVALKEQEAAGIDVVTGCFGQLLIRGPFRRSGEPPLYGCNHCASHRQRPLGVGVGEGFGRNATR